MKDTFARKTWMSLLIILGSIIIASGAFYYFSNDLTAQMTKIVSERQAVSGQNNALDSLAALKSQEPTAAAYTAAMKQLLPDQYGIVNFSAWLTTIAAKYGVSVSFAFTGNGTPSAQSTASTPGTIDFSLSISGPVDKANQYLKDIESQSPGFLFTLHSFDYTTDSSGEKLNAQGTLFFK